MITVSAELDRCNRAPASGEKVNYESYVYCARSSDWIEQQPSKLWVARSTRAGRRIEENRVNPTGSPKKILIVDDEESAVATLGAGLEASGYQILSAYTGEKGFQLARAEGPDVILLDIFLPGEDGLAILKKLKRPMDLETGEASKTRGIPVIVLTGRGEKMEEMFQAEDAFAFFTKPFELKALLASIRQALEKKVS